MQHYFVGQDEGSVVTQIEEDILDVFGDKYMNKHLVYGILELILVRLIPELRELGVSELMEDRGVAWDGKEATDEVKSTTTTVKSEVAADPAHRQ